MNAMPGSVLEPLYVDPQKIYVNSFLISSSLARRLWRRRKRRLKTPVLLNVYDDACAQSDDAICEMIPVRLSWHPAS